MTDALTLAVALEWATAFFGRVLLQHRHRLRRPEEEVLIFVACAHYYLDRALALTKEPPKVAPRPRRCDHKPDKKGRKTP